ncbi:MAG: ferrous iron transport protein B [Candidatus Heimdallarchaeaceae archaeon]
MPKQCPHCGKRSRFHRHRRDLRSFKKGLVSSERLSRQQKRAIKTQIFNGHTIEHKIAFLGNPNVGKSSLFNILTGSHQHIGNWPGKTVERKEGHFFLSDEYFSLVDLPGAYSLSARSEEEVITRDFIIEEKPDLICVIADATRLERTLFIALQAMELTDNVAIIINMKDIAEKECIDLDVGLLEEKLGVPVLYVCAYEDESIIRIKKFIYDSLHTKKYLFNPAMMVYSQKIEYMIQNISNQIADRKLLSEYPTRWVAFRILEGDQIVKDELAKEYDLADIEKKIEKQVKDDRFDPAVEISKRKYNALHQMVYSAVSGYEDFKETTSDRIDKALLHRFWGYPILTAIFAAFFLITFYASSPIITGIDWIFVQFSSWVLTSLESINSPAFLNSLLVNGVIAGVAAVLLFLPIITIFYALIAILEDSGYLARSAYLMDKVMGKFGMQGSAFLSLIMGFGCNVAGVMATRTIKNKRERTTMIIANSFIPCAARLGVIAFLTGIFFQPWLAAIIMLLLYGVSILLVLLTGLLLRLFYEHDDPLPLILELPEYRRPRFRSVMNLTWERAGIFLKKAGTFIFVASLVIWFLSNVPYVKPTENTVLLYVGMSPVIVTKISIAEFLGRGLEVITIPLFGFSWKMVVPLIFGIPAKEVIISALSILYPGGITRILWTIPQVISFLLFQLTYAPCFATIAVIKSETRSWKLTAIGFFYPLIVTSILTVIVFQIFSAIM